MHVFNFHMHTCMLSGSGSGERLGVYKGFLRHEGDVLGGGHAYTFPRIPPASHQEFPGSRGTPSLELFYSLHTHGQQGITDWIFIVVPCSPYIILNTTDHSAFHSFIP